MIKTLIITKCSNIGKLLPFCIFFFLLASCHDTLTSVKGCCKEPPQSIAFDNGWVFVPNIFTPNQDGVYDEWIIYGNSAMIKEISIWDENNILVFHGENLTINDTSAIWDGTYLGETKAGMYRYHIIIESFDYESYELTGRVCSFACDPENDDVGFDLFNCGFRWYDPSIEYDFPEPCFN